VVRSLGSQTKERTRGTENPQSFKENRPERKGMNHHCASFTWKPEKIRPAALEGMEKKGKKRNERGYILQNTDQEPGTRRKNLGRLPTQKNRGVKKLERNGGCGFKKSRGNLRRLETTRRGGKTNGCLIHANITSIGQKGKLSAQNEVDT